MRQDRIRLAYDALYAVIFPCDKETGILNIRNNFHAYTGLGLTNAEAEAVYYKIFPRLRPGDGMNLLRTQIIAQLEHVDISQYDVVDFDDLVDQAIELIDFYMQQNWLYKNLDELAPDVFWLLLEPLEK